MSGVAGGYRRLSIAAVLVTYLLIVAGGVVRVTGSGLGCGVTGQDWPLCHGQLVPPADLATLIEFTHRMFATGTMIAVGWLVVWTWLRYRSVRQLTVGATVATVLLIIQVLLGAVTVEMHLSPEIVTVHLANALVLLSVLIFTAHSAATVQTPRSAASTPLPRRTTSTVAIVVTFVVVLSGAFVVGRGAGLACGSLPLCGDGLTLSGTGLDSVNLLHRLVAVCGVLFLGYAMAMIRRGYSTDRALRVATMAVNVLLLAQVIAGIALVALRLPTPVRGIHLAIASALWAVVVLIGIRVRSRKAATA